MIQFNRQRNIAFISSFPPQRCGIATFTSHLIKHTYTASERLFEPVVVAIQSDSSQQFCAPVECTIRKDVRSDYMEAADYINSSDIEAVLLQHEFGLFGGQAGSYIVPLLRRLNVPVISTLHTVLGEPLSENFHTLVDICDCSNTVIVMNKRGIDMLRDLYGVPMRKIKLIPHGVPDVPFGKTEQYKHKLGLEKKKVLMTFGLIGPNKGIEVAIKAMPEIIKGNPNVLYLIVGRTHPEIVKRFGYSYRNKLQGIVEDLGIQKHVLFYDRFVTDEKLKTFLAAADIYITPYLHKEQLTSGTLAFAVGCGKAVVSTPYWAAEELLAQDRGVLVPFGNSRQIAETVSRLLKNELLLKRTQLSAYNYGRRMTWANVGQQYRRLVSKQLSKTLRNQKPEFPKHYRTVNLRGTELYQDYDRAIALK